MDVNPQNVGPIFAVMDAGCALCAKGAGWIARNDKSDEIQVIPMQSELGRTLLAQYRLDPDDPASWLYVENGEAFTSLDAYVRVGQRLGGFWKGLALLRFLPVPVQDALYHLVARNRHWLFPRTGLCTLPGSHVQPQANSISKE